MFPKNISSETTTKMSMQSNTQKYRALMAEPMAGKGVTCLPGIGNAYGGRFKEAGINNVNE